MEEKEENIPKKLTVLCIRTESMQGLPDMWNRSFTLRVDKDTTEETWQEALDALGAGATYQRYIMMKFTFRRGLTVCAW